MLYTYTLLNILESSDHCTKVDAESCHDLLTVFSNAFRELHTRLKIPYYELSVTKF